MATAGAEKPAAGRADPVPEKEKEKEALFAAKHAELVSEARDVAREHGVAVTTVAFRPDGTAVADEAVGVVYGMQERVRAMIERAIERKVAAMESGELAVHRRELQLLRGIVVGGMTQVKVAPGQKEEKDGGEVVVAKDKREVLGQQQETDGDAGAGAGCNKIVISRVE